MAPSASFSDLPVDVLDLIFPHLDAASFLSVTSTCKALHTPNFTYDSRFWSHLIRRTFRVPNQPVVQDDGRRWCNLYKRLLTQSKIYTWGKNASFCLGHSLDVPSDPTGGPIPRLRSILVPRRTRHVSWPTEMQGTQALGIVSDVQCGGWSTTLLTAKGALFTIGVMDGLHINRPRPPYSQHAKSELTSLRYPPGFVHPMERHEPSTATKQFSAGRCHVLALSDSGRIWTWQNINYPALHVKFLHHDTKEDGRDSGNGTVKKVVAGWNKSAALIEGTGIVLWMPLEHDHDQAEMEDTALILETAVVPRTNYRHLKAGTYRQVTGDDRSLADTVGEVRNFIVLEAVVLFNTHLGKVFAAQILWDDNEQRIGEPQELALHNPSPEGDELDRNEDFATDVQGSFHNFAVFLRSGAVLTSTQDRLMDLLRPASAPDTALATAKPLFTRIPALQQRDVISVAFGDYHFHALHSSGHITSYGHEPDSCGALGLGGDGAFGGSFGEIGDPQARLRGFCYRHHVGEGRLVPHAYSEGRRVWFEKEKREWIKFLAEGGVDRDEAAARIRGLNSQDLTAHGEVSEWIEQEGRDWESKYDVRREDDDGLSAYFALSITAAGWHSGAVVCVNEDLARRVREAVERPDPASGSNGVKYVWAEQHFPRLRLSNGEEMPGESQFDEWRYGRPEFDLTAGD